MALHLVDVVCQFLGVVWDREVFHALPEQVLWLHQEKGRHRNNPPPPPPPPLLPF